MLQARETTLTFFAMYLSPLTSKVYLFVKLFQSYMLPLFLNGMLSYLIGIKLRISSHVFCKRDNSVFLCYVLISPEAKILCRP